MKTLIMALSITSLTLAGCATGSSGVTTAYTSPIMYSGYSCAQLAVEDEMLRSQVAELKGAVDRSATNDKVMVGVGVLFFWPALFLIKGNGEEQGQYANLKGEHDAIQHAFILAGCAGGRVGGFGQQATTPLAASADGAPVQSGRYGDGTTVAAVVNRF